MDGEGLGADAAPLVEDPEGAGINQLAFAGSFVGPGGNSAEGCFSQQLG